MSRRAEFWYPAGGSARQPDPELRVGDAERSATADALSQHYSAGRLDDAELKERLDRAMGAKTHADLSGLLTDLPPLALPDPPGLPASRPRRHGIVLWGALAVLLLVMVAQWAVPLAGPWHAAHRWFWFPGPSWLVLVAGVLLWRRSRFRRHWYRSRF